MALETGKAFNPKGVFDGTFIPDAIAKYEGLPFSAKFLLCRLYRYAHKDGYAYPKQETLAEDLGVSVIQIKRLIKTLVEHKFIRIERSGEDKILHKPNKYIPLWHEAFESPTTVLSHSIASDTFDNKREDTLILRDKYLRDNIKEKEKINKKEKEKPDFLRDYPLSLNHPAFTSEWELWIQHRKEIKQPLTPTSVKRQFAFLEKLGLQKAVESVQQSLVNGWQGLFEPKRTPQANNGWREQFEQEKKQQDPFEQLKQQLKKDD